MNRIAFEFEDGTLLLLRDVDAPVRELEVVMEDTAYAPNPSPTGNAEIAVDVEIVARLRETDVRSLRDHLTRWLWKECERCGQPITGYPTVGAASAHGPGFCEDRRGWAK